ncbi:peptidoglycan-binding domain-containing protein [Arthrobacter rhombi]|uniref:peptidoglycan-binding domain-containing protein n=1 Tax=Arthrobacter rhombi TaxID=71253 RepID=UPI003FD006C7
MAYLKVDGKFYKKTRKQLQRYMKRNNWYFRAIDGDIGPHSWVSIQKMLRYFGRYRRAIDGSAGPYTWRALNDFLWIDFRGYTPTGPYYMKKRNSGIYTYKWSKQLVKALQNGLNVNYGK